MGKQPNYNLARMYCVALVMGEYEPPSFYLVYLNVATLLWF